MGLRALRIVVTESKIIGLAWLLVLGVVKLSAILLLAILEILATLFIGLTDMVERMHKMMFGSGS
jgi:hypothetical protein